MSKSAVKASEAKIGQPIVQNIPLTGDARVEPESEIEVVRSLAADKADMLRFMEEHVSVVVHRSGDKQSANIVEVWNGGVPQRFIRGQKQSVKRKFVEILARCRDITYDQDIGVDRSSGEAVQRMIPRIGLKYPFDVLEDANPKGKEWLQNLLQDA